MRVPLSAYLLVLSLSLPPAARAAEADLILHGGKVFLAPGRYAQAVAVADNRVSAVGADADVLALKGPKTRLIALGGRAVTPGFHDAHLHLVKGALALTQVDLNGSASIAEIQGRLLDWLSAHPEAEWVIGRGWDHTAFPEQRYPTRADLDAVISTRPVALTDVDGHKLWLNTEALRRAGISSRTPKLTHGGEVVRDAKGQPTGVLLEEAMGLARKALPKPTRGDTLSALRQALALARENGVTSMTSLEGPLDAEAEELFGLWKELQDKGEFTARLFIYGRLEEPAKLAKLRLAAAEFARTRFDVPGGKAFVDGVISARTAALLEPYFDDSKTKGSLNRLSWQLAGLVWEAHRRGLQAALHAIGDRAVREALDACARSAEKAAKQGLVLPRPPCRVEHAEVVSPRDRPRFKALGAVASMQPSHMTYDSEPLNYNPNRLGDRVAHAFSWKSLQDAGALLAFGTDWPVMPLPPRVNLFAATTRQHFNGKPEGGWIPQEKIGLEEAVLHYTWDPARAVGRGEELGQIAPGYLADLVVFDRDLFAASGRALLQVEVDLTVFDGKVVYERAGQKRAWSPY